MAVEKLFRAKIGKNKIASECVISDVLKFRDISYPGFSPFSDEKGLFQHPRLLSTFDLAQLVISGLTTVQLSHAKQKLCLLVLVGMFAVLLSAQQSPKLKSARVVSKS